MNLLNRIKEEIKLDNIELRVGETTTIICPFCAEAFKDQGKPSNIWTPNRSFSLTRTQTGLLYVCHRASCIANRGGFIPTGILADAPVKENKKKVFEKRLYNWDTVAIPEDVEKYLIHKYYLQPEDIYNNMFSFNLERGTVVMPIFTHQGYECGVVDRDFFSGRKPKAITYWFNDVPKINFPYQLFTGSSIVLTEDTISAIRVSKYVNSAALLGTHMPWSVAQHLLNIGKTDIYVMLDPDAVHKALTLYNRYSLSFRNFTVIPLSKSDPKDMTEEELKQCLQMYSS